jgi:hypothetical protein
VFSAKTQAARPKVITTHLPPLGTPWIEAFDDNDQMIGDIPDFTAPLGQWQNLTISTGSYNVRSVRFSSSTAASFPNAMKAIFDNLQFDQAPVVKPPPSCRCHPAFSDESARGSPSGDII